VTVILFILVAWLSSAPLYDWEEEEAKAWTPMAERYAAVDSFDEVHDVVIGRCSMCHAAEPVWDGLLWPPKGVMLETPQQIALQAEAIYVQSGVTHAMPPANLSGISEEERALIRAWFRSVDG
jgi:uncharacterized membrane protein